jgi:hypothetical protein
MEGQVSQAYCSQCNQQYPSGTLYCPNCGTRLPTIPHEDVKPISARRQISRTLVKVELSRKFSFLRFCGDLLSIIGVLEIISAWIVSGKVMGLVMQATTPTPDRMKYLSPPGYTISDQGFVAIVLVWVIITLIGLFTITFGQLVKLFISQHDEIQSMNALIRELSLLLTNEPD